jgi:hypothetical protein
MEASRAEKKRVAAGHARRRAESSMAPPVEKK